MATRMVVVLPHMQIWPFFTSVVTLMGLWITIYGGFSWFSSLLVVSTNSVAVEAVNLVLRLLEFSLGLHFGPFQVGLAFSAETHSL